MAKIDPETLQRLNSAVLNFSDACKRLNASAEATTLEMRDFAIYLDTPEANAANLLAKQAIVRAKE